MSAYYNDNDPAVCAWLRELIRHGIIADGEVDERSILDVRPDDLRGFTQVHFFAGIGGWSYALRLAGWPDDRPVWTGSPPCQPFSAAGKQLGRDDARHLAPHFVSLVGASRPGVLFGEQVASAEVFGKAPKGAGKAAGGGPEWAWIDDLSDRLEASHYAVGASDIPSAGVGAPHIRQRTFFGAVDLGWLDYGLGDGRGARRDRDHGRDERKLSDADGAAGGMADLHVHGRAQGWGDKPPAGHDGLVGNGPPRGLADRLGAGLEGQPGHGDRGDEPGRLDPSAAGPAPARCDALGVADAEGAGSPYRGAGTIQPLSAEGGGEPCGMADAHGGAGGQRCEVARGRDPRGHALARPGPCGDGSLGWPGAADDFWRAVDWLFCRDGVWRPVEPGTFPLVDGLPASLGKLPPEIQRLAAMAGLHAGNLRSAKSYRVESLRGYGNAINPHAAAAFIREFCAALGDLTQ